MIFSEVLYYTEYKKILNQYKDYLNPDGIVIISNFYSGKSLLSGHVQILDFAKQLFYYVDSLDINGTYLLDLSPPYTLLAELTRDSNFVLLFRKNSKGRALTLDPNCFPHRSSTKENNDD